MPIKSSKACSTIGCPSLTGCVSTLCILKKQGVHKAPETDIDHRGNYSRKNAYNSTRWRKVRSSQLSKEPLCQRCLSYDITTIGKDVDHVEPHRGNPRLMWDAINLQTLCHSCHSHKTGHEKQGKILDFRSFSSGSI